MRVASDMVTGAGGEGQRGAAGGTRDGRPRSATKLSPSALQRWNDAHYGA